MIPRALKDTAPNRPCSCFPCFVSTRRQVLATVASLLAGGLAPNFAPAQRKITVDLKSSCSFYPGAKIPDQVFEFGSSPEIFDIVKHITNSVGLQPNFELRQANVGNAAATLEDKKRCIIVQPGIPPRYLGDDGNRLGCKDNSRP
jgi:hypothetical protein